MGRFEALSENGAFIATGLAAFGGLLILFSTATTNVAALGANDAPLFAPSVYTSVAGLVTLIVAVCLGGSYACREKWNGTAALPCRWLLHNQLPISRNALQ